MSNEAKRIREKIGLSQSQFSERYGIPLATLKNWEQHRRQADDASLSYLWVIEYLPDQVADALAKRRRLNR